MLERSSWERELGDLKGFRACELGGRGGEVCPRCSAWLRRCAWGLEGWCHRCEGYVLDRAIVHRSRQPTQANIME